MTITYPRDMICGVGTCWFRLSHGVSVNRLNGGVTQVRQYAEPRWVADFSYSPMHRASYQAVEAWIDSLRGGLLDFYGHDPLKPLPITYRSGLPSGFPGDPITVFAVGTNSISVAGLPTGFVLKAGDHIGIKEGTRRGLFRIMEDFVGTTGALNVEPRVNGFTTAGFATLVRPACVMTIDVNTIQGGRTARQATPITFSAIQKVY
jgi:hypothetical protein